MSSLRVNKTSTAKQDLTDIATYIAVDSLDASDRFLQAADTAFLRLAEMPGLGTRRDFHNPYLKDIRYLPIAGFENYLIFYRVTEKGIDIIRVLHGARDVDALFDE